MRCDGELWQASLTFFRMETVDKTWDQIGRGLLLARLIVWLEGVVNDL
jgi:hypothetical protein